MKSAILALAAGLVLVVAPDARTQTVPALPEDPGAAVVEELVVQAKEPGPAWWVVTDGDSTVYILGMEGPIPPKPAWDRRWLDRRLKGANSLILADRWRISDRFNYRSLRSDIPLETRLQEPLRSQFVAARENLGQPAGRYAKWTPLFASMMLVGDSIPEDWVSPADDVIEAARKAKVPIVAAPSKNVSDMVSKVFSNTDPALETTCLSAAVRSVELARPYTVAEGWARGDVAAALSGPRTFEGCILLLNGGPQYWRAFADDQTRLIAEALKTPGHSVALVDISSMVAEEGVIRKLEARGLEVTGPDGR